MRYALIYLTIFASIFMVFGCEKTETSNRQIEDYEAKISELQLFIDEKEQKINQLTQQIREMSDQHGYPTPLESVFQEIPWLKKFNPGTKWDKVIISRYAGDHTTKTVEDPLFLENINWLLHIKSVGTVSFPNGYHSDVDFYTYELFQGEQSYTVKVVNRGVIETGKHELYFEVDKDIHLLGAAFMPKPAYIKHDGLIAKMAASGAVRRGNLYVIVSAFRVQSKISPLANSGKLLPDKPANVGEQIETFTFYYYGQELIMDIYRDHVMLSGDGEVEWYYLQDAGTTFTVEAG